MKKTLLLSLFITQFAILTAFAVEPVVVLDEDFSLFTAGTEENPDSEDITTASFNVKSQYTKIPKWIGYNVRQAGGVCALMEYNRADIGQGYGYISTPEMELYGEATVSFRARRAHGVTSAGNLDLALCDNTSGRLETTNFTLSDQWQEFIWTSKEATFNNKCIFQFTPMKGEILLDDIKIVRKRTTLPGIEVYEPENISTTEFKALWQDSNVTGKTGYYFSVFYKDWPETVIEPGLISFDCESLNLNSDNKTINSADPGYPEGWTIDVSTNGKTDVCTSQGDFNSGTKALNFDAEGDFIMSPTASAPIHKFSFWVKPSTMQREDYVFSLICVEVLIDGEWDVIANIPNYWMEEEGGYYVLEGDVLGEYVTQVRMSCVSKNLVTFAIDDIQIDYATQKVPYPLITDRFVTEPSCIVADIDPTKEHFYYVSQTDGEVSSKPSKIMWVNGIKGLAPVSLDATDVSETAFTANWQGLPNAAEYKVFINQEYETQVDNEEVEILSQDFSGVTSGSLNSPYNPYVSVYNLADNKLIDQDWFASAPSIVKGMLGSVGSGDGSAGLVVSPLLTLDDNSLAVDFTVHAVKPNEVIWVMIMDDLNAGYALYGLPIECGPSAGSVTKGVLFQNIQLNNKPVYVAFMSQIGTFYIDQVKISAIVPKRGSVVERPYKIVFTEDESCTVNRIRKLAPAYNYYVRAMRTYNFEDYVSDDSNKVRVQLYESAIEDVTVDSAEVYVENNVVNVVLTADARINVFNVMGANVVSALGHQGSNAIELGSGIYIVQVNNKSYKLFIK